MRTSTKLGLLGTLYLSQGLPFGFFTQALPALLRKEGVSLSLIGLASLLTLPWALKFLWAPLVDRGVSSRWGRRRGWILPLQGLTIVAMGSLALFDWKGGMVWVLGAFLLANLLAATQDIATDGLAVDLLRPEERGLGNGVQVAGYRVGMIIGGGVLLVVFSHLGWRWTFLLMALCLGLATVPTLLYKEPRALPVSAQERVEQGSMWSMWTSFVKQPGVAGWIVVILLYKGGDALATGMLRPFLVDLGLGLGQIGWLLGTAGFTAGLLGALAGGWGVQRLGRRRALLGFGLLQAFAVSLYILPALGATQMWLLYAVCTIEHFAGGMATAALFTIMMDLCRPTQAATDYTIQASLAVVAKGVASMLSGASAANLGYAAHFGFSALFCLVGLLAAFLFQARGTDSHIPATRGLPGAETSPVQAVLR